MKMLRLLRCLRKLISIEKLTDENTCLWLKPPQWPGWFSRKTYWPKHLPPTCLPNSSTPSGLRSGAELFPWVSTHGYSDLDLSGHFPFRIIDLRERRFYSTRREAYSMRRVTHSMRRGAYSTRREVYSTRRETYST